MKWIYCRCIFGVVLSMVVTQSFSDQIKKTIFGLTNAQHFQSKRAGDFFIQMGSFSNKLNASNYQKSLRLKSALPIVIEKKNGYYRVAIGPVHSAVQVRSIGQSLNATPTLAAKITRSQTVKRSPMKMNSVVGNIKLAPSIQHRTAIIKKTPNNEPISPSASWQGNWFLAGGAGGQFPEFKPSMTVNNGSGFPAPYNKDIYSTNKSNKLMLGAALGRRWHRDRVWLPSYSLGGSYQHFFTGNVGGTVMQYSLPEFTNYNYRWRLASDVVLAIAKLNLAQYQRVSPFINGGIGGAFNRTSGYSETALPGVTPRISPSYASKTKGNFAYNLGAGLDFNVMPQMTLSAGYLYQDFGSLASGPGTQSWSSQSLNLGSYHSNNAFMSVNYLFNQ